LKIDFSVGRSQEQAPIDQVPFHIWELPKGTDWAVFYRLQEGYLLRFPSYADFYVSYDGSKVLAAPVPETTEATIEHLYLNQALPLALSRQGALMFHASAVVLDDAVAVAFMATSGAGKSTLAASFAKAGYPFLTDDGLRVERDSEERYLVYASHPSLRLWDDSLDHLFDDNVQQAPAVSYTSKTRILSDDRLPYCSTPTQLRRVYFLGDGEASAPMMEPLSPSETLVALTSHSFLLDIESREHIARHFDWLAQFVKQPLFYRLDYPRDYDTLPAVRAAIIAHSHDREGEKFVETHGSN
jgi:hypothetical protein